VAGQIHQFTGPVHELLPTNSVDVSALVEEDLSTLTSGVMNSAKKPAPKNFLLKGSTTCEKFF
jgi:hypothetical protein